MAYGENKEQTADTCKVSVIVPMYNCGKYLEALFANLAAQTLDSFEVICVNDGSTDDTLERIKEQCAKDGRFRLADKENGGAGTARNEGLKHARGKYVQWFDADDTCSPEMLSVLYEAAEEKQADITMCLHDEYDFILNRNRPNLGFTRKWFPDGKVVDPRTVSNLYAQIGFGIWNKLYRRNFVEEHGLRFSATAVANDVFFLYGASSAAKRITGIHRNLLTVRKHINPGSISTNRAEHTEDSMQVLEDLSVWLREQGLEETYRETLAKSVIYSANYNAEFPYNHRFVRSVVEMFCEKEPWRELDPATLREWTDEKYCIPVFEKERRQMQEALDSGATGTGADPVGRIRRLNNKIFAFHTMNRMAKEKYGYTLFAGSEEETLSRIREETEAYKTKNAAFKKELTKLKKELEREKHSWNHRIGKAVTFLPKKVRRVFRRK